MMHLILVAALARPCGGDLNQAELDECWLEHAEVAQRDLDKTFAQFEAEAAAAGLKTAPYVAAQTAWSSAREKTCDFEESLEEGGSIAPMMYSECEARMTQARAAHVRDLYRIFEETGRTNPPEPLSPKAGKELARVYSLLLKRDLSQSSRAKLLASQSAWNAFRDAQCAAERGSCLTELAIERTAELEAGWLGEQFW